MDHNYDSSESNSFYSKFMNGGNSDNDDSKNELVLMERELLILLKSKKFSAVIEEGYRALGKFGPHEHLYKCVLVALLRLGKCKECTQLLEQWRKSNPNDPANVNTIIMIESIISAVELPGANRLEILINFENSIGLNKEWAFRNCDQFTKKWRFRTPPRQLSTGRYSLCPALVGCFYGDDCPSAHSREELDEWNLRMELTECNFYEMNSALTKQNLEPNESSNKHRGMNSSVGPRLSNVQSNGHFQSLTSVFPTTQTFKFSNGRTVTANCYSNENPFGQMCQTPTNIPYLNELIGKYKNRIDFPNVFASEIEDVRFKTFGSLTLKTNKGEHIWALAIASRDALRTVSLLHDDNRRHFHIAEGTFYYLSTPVNLKNLHQVNRNSGLQVLNTFIPSDIIKDYGGWPQWFYYKIDIAFRTDTPGQFRQAVVFDFKKDPKLIKEIAIEVELGVESVSPKRITSPDKNAVQVMVVDSNSGFPVTNGNWNHSTSLKAGKGQSVLLNKTNYVQEMTKFLGQEISCEQFELRKLDKYQDLTPTNICIIDGEEKSGSQLYCTIHLGDALNEDTPVGKLIKRSSHQVLLTSADYPSRSYMCPITEKLKTSIVVALGKAIIQDLALQIGRPYNFKVELHLDVKYFDKMKRALNMISNLELDFLFPDFTRDVIFDNDLVNIFLQGAFTLNQKQMEAYTAITASAVGITNVPPIILIGPFGTGKTYTLCQSVKKLIQCQLNSRILICTHSNSASDIYITEMDEWNIPNFQPLRVYFHDRRVQTVSNVVKKYCKFESSGRFRYPTKEEISNHRVIVTTLSISTELARMGLGKYFFTHIIIDESAQVLETEAIEPLILANGSTRIVLAGDHMQLSPELFSVDGGSSTNILERLNSYYPQGHPCKIMLNENYRSHATILKFASDHFYFGSLKCSTIQPGHQQLHPLTFFSVRGTEALGPTSFYNSAEIQELGTRLESLVSTWPKTWGPVEDPSSIAILTPYTDQVQKLRTHLRHRNLSYVSVERVQNVQGKQFRVVFISTVRTIVSPNESDLDLGFLSNAKLFNTALTRAQSLVAVVGDPISLCSTGKCRNTWLAYVQEAALNNGLFGIQYEKLSTSLMESRAQLKPPTPDIITSNGFHNYQHIQAPPPLTPPQPIASYNSFNSSFGPSIFSNANSNMAYRADNNPSQLRLGPGLIPPLATSPIGSDRFQGNFNKPSLYGSNTTNFNNMPTPNNLSLNTSNIGPFTPYYQLSPTNITSTSVISSNNFPTLPINPGLIGHPIGSKFGGIPRPSAPPGFAERPALVNMPAFEDQFAKAMRIPSVDSVSKSLTLNGNHHMGTNAKPVIAKDSNGISNGMPVNNEKRKTGSNTSIASPPLLSLPLDEFPTLASEKQVKKSTDWIEVKAKKPKAQVANGNSKSKDNSQKPVVEKIAILVSMGYDKKRSIKALQLTDKDLEKAKELLLATKDKEKISIKDLPN